MREHAREYVDAGVGIPTLVQPLHTPTSKLVKGEPVPNRRAIVKSKKKPEQYVVLSDIPELFERAGKELDRLSPHPVDKCVRAVKAKYLTRIPVELIRTQGREGECIPLSEITEEERQQAQAASAIADQVVKAGPSLPAERFVELMKNSPRQDLTREAIKAARRSRPATLLGPGISVAQGPIDVPAELTCSEPQLVRVRALGFAPDQRWVIAKISHVGAHHEFWRYFDELRVAIEVTDPQDLRTLVLSYFIEAEVGIEITPTVVLPRGSLKHETVRAALTNSLDHRDIAARALGMLTEQLRLDL